MRISVVINTYNRGESLRRTLSSFRHQTYADFEVVVVNGPSTDSTAEVLAEFAGLIRVADCPAVHLSKSRNVGIEAAAGDVVAFIDDDAIPEPDWLAGLAAAYEQPDVCGAGGLVYDHTGVRFQYEYSVCDRFGSPSFDRRPPFDEYTSPGADPFLYLQGTNCSFRRECLIDIGGFDEEIEYYLDEAEVCMRMADFGFRLKPLTGAAVHHKYLASHIRNHKKRVLDPYSTVKNQCYFAIQKGREARSLREAFAYLSHYLEAVRQGGISGHKMGELTDEQLAHYLARVDEGVEIGVERGMNQPRRIREFGPRPTGAFKPFPVLRPEGRRMTVCFVSQEYPPGDFGGIGRFFHDMAVGFAEAGHEVHVVTRTPDDARVDLEDGVWVHRVDPEAPDLRELAGQPLEGNFRLIAASYHEVCRIHEKSPVDLVMAPLWNCEGLMSALDGRFPVVHTLQTTLRTVVELEPSIGDSVHAAQLSALEDLTLRAAGHVMPISRSVLETCRRLHGGFTAEPHLNPLGSRDRSDEFFRERGDDGRLRVLYVGRLEQRKGVDLLMSAAEALLDEFPDVEFYFVGKDNPNPKTGHSYLAEHRELVRRRPELADRIVFTGGADEDQLFQHYADCDLFVLPSRYESFGLVLTEAMMFGKPVIASDAGSLPEVVEEGGNGLLFRNGDADSLADRLRELIRDAGTRARFGRRSRELFERKFDRSIMVRNTIALHGEIAESFRAERGDGGVDLGGRHDRAVRGLARVVAGACGLDDARATAVAKELFYRPGSDPLIDFGGKLLDWWDLPARDFVKRVYPLILKRTADDCGIDWYAERIGREMGRIDFVRTLAHSEEARAGKHDPTWLEAFMPPPEPTLEAPAVPAASVVVVRPGLKARARAKLARMPLVGKGLRYVKRLIGVPVYSHRMLARTAETEQALLARHAALSHELSELKEAVQRRIGRQERDLVHAVGVQLRELRDQLAEREERRVAELTLLRDAVNELRRRANSSDSPRPMDRAA